MPCGREASQLKLYFIPAQAGVLQLSFGRQGRRLTQNMHSLVPGPDPSGSRKGLPQRLWPVR